MRLIQVACGLLTIAIPFQVTPVARAATFTVTTTSDSGTGSLRQAILDANATSGADTIAFNISGSGVRTISPGSALPPILDPVVIDATTQPGYSTRPLIELNGANAGANSGIRILVGNSTIRGLAINRFGADGITIQGSGTNVIQGNYIGTDPTGATARPNAQEGVLIMNSYGNTVGGTNSLLRNVISGNTDAGVYLLNGGGNTVVGNFIGTRASGTLALGNSNMGIAIYNSARNVIGGKSAGERNVISGNTSSGIYLFGSGATQNVIAGNFIGTDGTGTLALGNHGDGITVSGAPVNLVGGTNSGAGNVISGNLQTGVFLDGSGAFNNLLIGNFVGTDAAGTSAVGNGYAGIALSGAVSNRIGFPAVPNKPNVIAGNRQDGILISTNSTGNLIQANLIGTDLSGLKAISNAFSGVSITAANSNQVGGSISGTRNLISGNAVYGILLTAGSSENWVQGNLIGTAGNGTSALPNRASGIRLESPANLVGGTSLGAANVISGNTQDGILLVGAAARNNLVQGNLIGTDLLGAAAVGNGRAGVGLSGAPANQIGGAGAGEGNTISGNRDAGIYMIAAGASDNHVTGNRIGTDLSGMIALKNRLEGVYVERAPSNTIGGASAGLGNLISGNGTRGIWLTNACCNTIQGNSIGTAIDGQTALSNGAHGIECEVGANGNLIGGTEETGNRLAYAPDVYTGVRIRDGSVRNLILYNRIFANAGPGIDLGAYGISANDSCDADDGANALQNFPVLRAARITSTGVWITGTLDSVAGQSYRIQFFANSVDPAAFYSQARTFLGETVVTLASTCVASFSATFEAGITQGTYVTATATDPAGNTSEFSTAIPAVIAPVLTATPTGPGQLKFSWTASASGTVLVQAHSLTPPITWTPVPGSPVLVNGEYVLTVQVDGAPRFYALSHQ